VNRHNDIGSLIGDTLRRRADPNGAREVIILLLDGAIVYWGSYALRRYSSKRPSLRNFEA
jgi:hypothetical protein